MGFGKKAVLSLLAVPLGLLDAAIAAAFVPFRRIVKDFSLRKLFDDAFYVYDLNKESRFVKNYSSKVPAGPMAFLGAAGVLGTVLCLGTLGVVAAAFIPHFI